MSSGVVIPKALEANEKEAQGRRLEEVNRLMAAINASIQPKMETIYVCLKPYTTVNMSPSELYYVCQVRKVAKYWGKRTR